MTQHPLFFIALVLCVYGSHTVSGYTLTTTLQGSNFFPAFSFFTEDDPTHGFVNYVDSKTAWNAGLVNITAENKVLIPEKIRMQHLILNVTLYYHKTIVRIHNTHHHKTNPTRLLTPHQKITHRTLTANAIPHATPHHHTRSPSILEPTPPLMTSLYRSTLDAITAQSHLAGDETR